jgi:hypothetical protein
MGMLLYIEQLYEPAKGVPRRPTASSAHMIKNASKTAPQMAILYFMFFTFLKTNSHARPVTVNKILIITKSPADQSNPATSGISNSNATAAKMMNNLLFFIIINTISYSDSMRTEPDATV